MFELQEGYYYVTLREDYVRLFQMSAEQRFEQGAKTEKEKEEYVRRSNHAVARAYIMAVLEQLSDQQIANGTREAKVRVYLSFQELETRVHGGCKLRVLRYAMTELLEDGYVRRVPNPDPRFRTPCYRIHAEKFRCELQALPVNDTRHKLDEEEEKEEKREDFSKSHADLPSTIADLPGKNADLPGSSADLPGKNADLPGNSADLPGKNADLPGNSADLPTRITKRNKRITEEKRERNIEITLSAQAQVIYVAWCSLFTVEVPLTQTIARAAQGLVKPVASWCEELHITPAELLRRMMNRLYETDKTGYYKRGVKLYDLEREFEAWQSATERTLRKKSSQRHIPTLAEDPYSIAALIASQNPGYFASQEGAQSTYGE